MVAGQAQKEFFVNETLCLADALLHPAVEGEINDPPADPAPGESWLAGDNPTGAWTGHAGSLASWQAGAWIFATPRDGMRVLDRSTGQDIRYLGGWRRPERPENPASGATVDSEARETIVKLIAALTDSGILV